MTTDDLQKKKSTQVRAWVSTKTPLKAMASLLDITVPELKRQYKVELKDGHDIVYATISSKVVQAAFGGDVRSMLAWLRQYGGWQEITRRELTGKNGEPISFRNLDNIALASVIEALAAQGTTGRGKGRNGPAIEGVAGEVVDLDAIPGAADESTE